MAEVAVRNGVELHRSCPVTHIEKTAGGWALTTPSGIVETRYIINAAGISAQAVHDMAAPHKFTIQPTRGEYYLLDKSEGSRVHHVIFQYQLYIIDNHAVVPIRCRRSATRSRTV
mgnify:FL=1